MVEYNNLQNFTHKTPISIELNQKSEFDNPTIAPNILVNILDFLISNNFNKITLLLDNTSLIATITKPSEVNDFLDLQILQKHLNFEYPQKHQMKVFGNFIEITIDLKE